MVITFWWCQLLCMHHAITTLAKMWWYDRLKNALSYRHNAQMTYQELFWGDITGKHTSKSMYSLPMVNNVRQTDLRVYIGNNDNQEGRRKITTVDITIKLTTNVDLNLNTCIGKLFLSCESRNNPLQAQLLFDIACIAGAPSTWNNILSLQI